MRGVGGCWGIDAGAVLSTSVQRVCYCLQMHMRWIADMRDLMGRNRLPTRYGDVTTGFMIAPSKMSGERITTKWRYNI